MSPYFVLVAAVIVGVLSSARLTRLLAQDSYPPAIWLREKWEDLTKGNDWEELLTCHWCLAPWMTLPILLWGWLSDLHAAWWVVNGWLAAAYVASMIVERDEVV